MSISDLSDESARAVARRWWISFAVLWLLGLCYATGGELRGDEYAHFAQLQAFVRGDWRVMREAMTTVPAYHALLALAMNSLGVDSLGAARAISGVCGLLAVAGFVRLHRAVLGSDDWIGAAQFALLPPLVPFVFLVYTDVASLAALLWAADSSVRAQHFRAALFLLLALAMRQNNVFWVAFFALLAVWPVLRKRDWVSVRKTLLSLWPYLLPVLAFVAYWAWNGSISYSPQQAQMHPDASLHAGNLYFMLFCCALLLPLQVVDGLRRFANAARSQPWRWLWPLLLLLGFWLTFTVDHPYNLIENAVSWRNRVLQLTQYSVGFKVLFGALATLAAVGLSSQPLAIGSARWLYPFAALFVSLSWLIEQRYFLIPLTLFLAFRLPLSRRIEAATMALWGVLAVFLFWGMISGRWYL